MNTAATHLLMFPPQDGDHNGKKVFRNRIHFFMQQREYQKYLEYRLYLNLDLPTFSRNFHIATCMMYVLQVNLSQKLSFLNQLTHNVTRDCSLNYKKSTSSEHVVYKFCFKYQNNNKKTNFCTQHVLNLYFSCNSMKNLSSYCGLTDSRMRASNKYIFTCTYKI